MINTRLLWAFWVVISIGFYTQPIKAYLGAGAAELEAVPHEECQFQEIDPERWGGQGFVNPPEIRSVDGVLKTTLVVGYGGSVIAGCEVSLRVYNPSVLEDGAAIVGPTLRAKPGDTLYIKLENRLEAVPGTEEFNVTNLHTHGLHVSPSGNSDNVLLRIKPGETVDYEIKIPDDHPSGTFWYHAHVHGSTAIQVSSGMSGGLIIEGGLDNLPAIAEARERIFVLQQIAYGEHGLLESYSAFGPGEWGNSKRHVTINGRIMPLIVLRPGEVERWRLIHSGIRETINLVLQDHDLHEIALDGIALGKMDTWVDAPITLDPGYRSDVLVKAELLPQGVTESVFYVLDGRLEGRESLQFFAPTGDQEMEQEALQNIKPERILAKVVIRGEPVDMQLPENASLAQYAPFEPIKPEELTGEPQKVSFSIERAKCPDPGVPCIPCNAGEEGCEVRFMVNFRPFSKNHVRTLALNTASEWELETALTSFAPSHPYHIHVNPFEMIRKGPDGEDESVWKDTVIVKQGQPFKIRSRYEEFTGKFVLHCHILDHEDEGMMELVEIVE